MLHSLAAPPPSTLCGVIRNSHLILWIKFLCQKKEYSKIRIQTQCYVKCWSTMLSSTCFRCFPHVTATHCLRYTVEFFCFSSFNMCGLFFCTLSFKTPQRQKSNGVRYGDWGGHTFWEIILPKNLCNICMYLRPFLLKLVEFCITFQQGHEIHNLFVVKFSWYCFSDTKGADYSPFRDTTPCSSDF
jgi:hypothetical protein